MKLIFNQEYVSDLLLHLTSSTDRKSMDRVKILMKIVRICSQLQQEMDLLRTVDGYTVLSQACFNGMDDIVDHLLKISDEQGSTRDLINCGMPPPLWLATAEGHDKVISVFASKEALIDNPVKAPDGTTPLQIAVIKESFKCVQQLEKTALYSRAEIEREIVRFGSMTLANEYRFKDVAPTDLLEIARTSDNLDIVPKILENWPNNQSSGLSSLLSDSNFGEAKQSSFLTELSLQYPIFNENVQEDCWNVNFKGTENEHGDVMISLEDDIETTFMKRCCILMADGYTNTNSVHQYDLSLDFQCPPSCTQ